MWPVLQEIYSHRTSVLQQNHPCISLQLSPSIVICKEKEGGSENDRREQRRKAKERDREGGREGGRKEESMVRERRGYYRSVASMIDTLAILDSSSAVRDSFSFTCDTPK